MLRFYPENFIIGWNEILFRSANLLWQGSERQAANKMSRATLNFRFLSVALPAAKPNCRAFTK